MTATLTAPPVEERARRQTLTRYSGAVRVRGLDGVLWDVVPAELEASPSPAVPTSGELLVPAGAALAHWCGPVLLDLPNGSVRAIVTPVGRRKGVAVIRVTGLTPLPHCDDV